MNLTVTFPLGVMYLSNPTWYIDPTEGWTVENLLDDIVYAAKVQGGYKLQKDGADLEPTALVVAVLQEGDTVALVEA